MSIKEIVTLKFELPKQFRGCRVTDVGASIHFDRSNPGRIEVRVEADTPNGCNVTFWVKEPKATISQRTVNSRECCGCGMDNDDCVCEVT